MRRILITTGLIAALAAPALAPTGAQAESCEQRSHDHKVVGTLLGAVAGGFLGNAVARGGGRTGGTIIGAGAGAVVGNNLARTNCDHRAYYRHPARSDGYAPAAYSANGRSCRTETRSFYDAHGQLVYAPTQVCN
jgi:uncharacterized protein YcfJ